MDSQMAAKEVDSDDVKKQEINDITTCCICTEIYTDPKGLPCIHTFCMKCIQETGLKTNKGPGDEMPCPICRRMFKIPPEGFHGLPKNFFIERLIEVENLSDQPESSIPLCDACIEENEETGRPRPKEISAAHSFCAECNQKFCEECCRQHRKFKLTKHHRLIPMTEHESGRTVMTNIAPSVCEQHEQKVLDVYCSDCKTVVCAICFIDGHNNHKGSHVTKFVDDFRKQIESSYQVINECRSRAEIRKTDLLKVKEAIQGRVATLECEIENRKDEVKQIIEKHATSLLRDLCSMRQSKLKEIQLDTDDIDTYLSSLETYNSYCQNIMTMGSASDICRAFSDLSSRAVELQHQSQLANETEDQFLAFSFRKSDLEQFLVESSDNLIGEIQKDGELKPKKTFKQIVPADQSNGNELLSLRSANEQLRIDVNNEVEANKTHKMTIKTFENSVEKLEQELIRMKQDQLRYISDPVKTQTIKTKAAKGEKKAIYGLTILDKELFFVSKDSSEVEVCDSIKFSFSRRWNLKELITPTDIGSCNNNKCLYIMDYKGDNQPKEILRVDAKGKLIKKWSTGDIWSNLSVTDESNVILSDYYRSKLYEYSPEGQLINEINISSDADIRYIRYAIKLTNDLFLVSHGYFDDGNEDGDDDDANVHDDNDDYDDDDYYSDYSDDDDDYDDDDDDDDDDRQRVCIVDADGKLRKSFGGERGSTIAQLNDPVHVFVDGNGFIMVADRFNSRVILLDSDLKFKREILSEEKHGLRNPSRILLDESNGQLIVADSEWNFGKKTSLDGRISIFDFE